MESWGLFRGSEAVARGDATWRQLCGPAFVRLVRDVYVVRGTDVSHLLRCAAAVMIAPADAVLTGRSAASVLGMDLAQPWDPVEMVVGEPYRFGPVRGLAIRRTHRPAIESTPWRQGRLATPARMALDLALRPSIADAVADLDVVVRSGHLDEDALRRALAGRRERGIRRARAAAGLVDPRAESRPESRLRTVLRLAGIPLTPQVEVRTSGGAFVARLDLAAEDIRLGVEYHGAWHADRLQVGRDFARLNAVENQGWRVVVVTAEHMRNVTEVVERVAAARTAQRLAAADRSRRAHSP